MNRKEAAPAPIIAIFWNGFTYFLIETVVNLKSGSFEIGSTTLLVKLLVLFKSFSSCFPQCIGRKTTFSLIESVTFAFTRTSPFLLLTVTISPFLISFLKASIGFISKTGLGIWVNKRETFPVFVIVCHWSRILPVVRINGNSSFG
ncbi:hypothetical protein D9M70_601140 [compost metagenome]